MAKRRSSKPSGIKLRGVVIPLVVVAGLLGVFMMGSGMDRLIENQIFFPEEFMVDDPGRHGLEYEDLEITTSDKVKLHGWLVEAEGAGELILFFHGNAGNISHRVDNLVRLHRIGAAVMIIDYRGYGQSEGSISEQGMYLDAEAAYDYALKRAQAQGRKLVVFGRSLGGVAAVHVATARPCHGLILESTFTNLGEMAASFFPIPGISSMLKKRMSSITKIPALRAPLLMLHGDRDNIVPYELGQKLYAEVQGPKEFVTLSGAGHNDTYFVAGKSYWQTWRRFLDGLPAEPVAPAGQ